MTDVPRPVAALRAAHPGAVVAHAPGRVNLIGGHVDAHDGLLVSMAIDRGVAVAARRRDDRRITAVSSSVPGSVETTADGSDDAASITPSWGRLVAAVAAELAVLGRPAVGAELHVEADLTAGGGLSSSAALEVALASALCAVADFPIDAFELVHVAQRSELRATGVPCGVQDPWSSIAGVQGHGLLLDCEAMTATPLAMPAEVALVVVDSGVSRTLEGSPWTLRRAESFERAHALGRATLRHTTLAEVEGHPRARHVVTEIARVERFAQALRAGDVVAAGALMIESHASSRDDYESSIPELDLLVDALVAAGGPRGPPRPPPDRWRLRGLCRGTGGPRERSEDRGRHSSCLSITVRARRHCAGDPARHRRPALVNLPAPAGQPKGMRASLLRS